MNNRRKKTRLVNPFKPRYQTRRERKRAEYRELRPEVRERALERYGYRCVFPTCRIGLSLDAMHGHEVIWRGRGGSATDEDNVVPCCARCHAHIHVRIGGVLKRIERTEAGGLRFFERVNGKSPWIERLAYEHSGSRTGVEGSRSAGEQPHDRGDDDDR